MNSPRTYTTMKAIHLVVLVISVKLIVGEPFLSDKSGEKSPRFLKAQSTTTFTDYVFSTKTIFPQCVSSVQEALCANRRKKRMTLEEIDDYRIAESKQSVDDIQSSLGTESKAIESAAGKDRDPRFGFVIWTTSRVTSTATVKFTNTGSTISLIFVCTVGGLEFPSPFSCIT